MDEQQVLKEIEKALNQVLKDKGYERTALLWSPGSAGLGIEAAWVGQCISAIPGTVNWAYQTLAGVSTDALSTSQLLATVGDPLDKTEGNFANTYTSQFKRGKTLLGTVSSGSYIDITMGKDYLRFQLQAAVFDILGSGTKVPFTNRGVAVFEAAVSVVAASGRAASAVVQRWEHSAARSA